VQVFATPPFWPQTVINNDFNIFPTLDNICLMSSEKQIKNINNQN